MHTAFTGTGPDSDLNSPRLSPAESRHIEESTVTPCDRDGPTPLSDSIQRTERPTHSCSVRVRVAAGTSGTRRTLPVSIAARLCPCTVRRRRHAADSVTVTVEPVDPRESSRSVGRPGAARWRLTNASDREAEAQVLRVGGAAGPRLAAPRPAGD